MTQKLNMIFYNYISSLKFCTSKPNLHINSRKLPFLYRSIIVLNGNVPDKSFFIHYLPIIAVDGAANQLISLGIRPDVVIGDLDSIDSKLLTKLNTIYIPNQDHCDFYKAIDYLTTVKLLPAIITGIDGGTIDHILQNVNIFLSTNSIFYAPPIVGHILSTGIVKFISLPSNTKISLIGMPAAQISTKGLKWELDNYNLTFPGRNSCFNRTASNKFSISVHTGICLAMIYLEAVYDAGLK